MKFNLPKKTIYLAPSIKVLVVSAGGVGTTFLIKHISKYQKTNCPDNTDGYKHLPIPPLSRNNNLKVIYLIGDPILSCISLFRRSYHYTQSKNAVKYSNLKSIENIELTLPEYAQNGADRFYFQYQFHNWFERFPLHNTLFLKYDTLFESIEVIREFLNLPQEFTDDFPSKQQRVSALELVDPLILSSLEKMYGNYRIEINQLPKNILKHGEGFQYSYLKSSVYLLALIDAFFRKYPIWRKLKNILISLLSFKGRRDYIW